MKREAVALCRVSSAEQRVDGSSLDSQQKHANDFARNVLECEIDKLWSLDVSSKAGKNLKRKDLMEILDYCKKHRYIKYFIVDKVNRLARETDFFYWYRYELKKIGVKTYWADPNKQDLNREDQYAGIKTFFEAHEAEQDNKERAETTITRMKDRTLAGYRLAPVLQGYKKTTIPGLHEPDEPLFTLLRSSMRDILSGRFTVYEALEDLKKQGYKTPSGRELRIDKFRKILSDDYYAGLTTIKKSDDERFKGIQGLHRAMITPEEHQELIAIVKGKKRVFERKKDRKEFPLGNIGYCECGGKLVGFDHSNGNGWSQPKYRCRKCKKQYHTARVHHSLDLAFQKIRFNMKEEDIFVGALTQVWKSEEKILVEKLRILKQKLENLKEEKTQIVRKIALNTDTDIDGDLKEVLGEIKSKIGEMEQEISVANESESDMVNFITFSLKFLDERMDIWKDLDRSERIKCKQLLIPGEIFVSFSEKVCTPQISPILISIGKEKEAQMASKSHMVEVEGVSPSSKRSKTRLLQV